MILLDTDHVSFVFGKPSLLSERLLGRIDITRKSQPVATTILTYEEQFRGWMKLLARARTVKDEIEAYARLRKHLDDFKQLNVIEFDERAAVEYQRLKNLKIRIGSMDLKIAAITLSHDATLWSRNLVDFQKVPGLKIEDATT